MNERIKELLESSIIESSQWTGSKPAITITYDTLDHFAQLIVKECINQALEEKVPEETIDKEDDVEDRCYLRGNNGGIVDAVIRIKQHFGVE